MSRAMGHRGITAFGIDPTVLVVGLAPRTPDVDGQAFGGARHIEPADQSGSSGFKDLAVVIVKTLVSEQRDRQPHRAAAKVVQGRIAVRGLSVVTGADRSGLSLQLCIFGPSRAWLTTADGRQQSSQYSSNFSNHRRRRSSQRACPRIPWSQRNSRTPARQ